MRHTHARWSQYLITPTVPVAQFVEHLLTDGLFPSLAIRLPGWFGRQFESLQVGRLDFDLATALLGIAAVLLTLILVT